MQKISRIPIAVIAFFAMSLGLWSCQWHTIEPVRLEVIDPDTADPVLFSTQLEPIFVSKCAGCHSSRKPILTDGNAYNGITSEGYVNTSDPESSIIYTKMKIDQHPGAASTFSQSELALLLTWIQQGANNN